MVIRFFSQSETHREFSNFAPFGIDLDGSWWPTVENYYQAQKFTDPDFRQSIRRAERPTIAKTLPMRTRPRSGPTGTRSRTR
jgi:predicted NAD-dependent protein-ADP-ribosyltransferase YbiA (DUF1768 family)